MRAASPIPTSLGKKVSVCLLTYNHVDTIGSTMESVLNQTLSGYEIIVSDDYSTDGTWERIQRTARQDPRIRRIRTTTNLGMAGNANFAVAQSRRPYVALLHHDDIYRPDLLEKWVAVLESAEDIAFAFNAYGVYASNEIQGKRIPAGRIAGEWLLTHHLFPHWGCVVRGTAMIRRCAWEQLGGMHEKFGLLADVDLWMRLARQWSVGYVAEPIVIIRQQRPHYYPDIYTGKEWHWERQRLLYEIHASNRLRYYDLSTLSGRMNWWIFRLRLSLETAKWLTYAVLRNKRGIIAHSVESETAYDLIPLKWYRNTLRRLEHLMPRRG